MTGTLKGRCECGQVVFTVVSPRRAVTVCHCGQCRRTAGHAWASTHAPYASLRFETDEGLEWYASSEMAKRGFCRHCGSSLFYRLNGEDGIGIAAGCLEAPTGLRVTRHIFVADQGDYYTIDDDLPRFERSSSAGGTPSP